MENLLIKAKRKYTEKTILGIKRSYRTCVEFCGSLENPGLGLDRPDLVDYSQVAATPDQLRIGAYLSQQNLGRKAILHVGVGDSSLAQTLSPLVQQIDGLTVCWNEKHVADALHLSNYRAFYLNKYSRELLTGLSGPYDFIVDNNLASFACCKFHFYRMIETYLHLLKPGGSILTDQSGMDWVIDDPRWQLSFSDLVEIGTMFSAQVSKCTDSIYAIQKPEANSSELNTGMRMKCP
jgi:hypothetical protein